MDKKFILFVLISAVILFGWTVLFPGKAPEKRTEKTVAREEERTREEPEPEEPAEPRTAELPGLSSKHHVVSGTELVVVTPLYEAKYRDGGLVSLTLTHYPDDEETLLLQRFGESEIPTLAPVFPEDTVRGAVWSVSKPRVEISAGEEETVVWELATGWERLFVSKLTFSGESYDVKVEVEKPESEGPVTLSLGSFKKKEGDPGEVDDVSIEAMVGADKPRDKLKGDSGTKRYEGDVAWAALRSKYFIFGLVPDKGLAVEVNREDRKDIAGFLTVDTPGKLTFYAGPKVYDTLRTKGVGLERTVDLGWSFIGWIAAIILIFLNWINSYTGNYGISITVLTVVIKIITYPLTAKSLASSKKMQEIQPVLKEVQAKYKDNPEKLNQELMEVYRKYKINPLGGCLPLIIQIPIFYAFFNTLRNAVDLKGAPFFLWVNDLSKPDALFALRFKIPLINADTFNVLPLVMTAVWAVQMITGQPTGVKSEQQKIMMIMPIAFGFLLYNMPSGLVIYWTVNTLLTLVQQVIMARVGRSKEVAPK